MASRDTSASRSDSNSNGVQSGLPHMDSSDYHSIQSPFTLLPLSAAASTTGVVPASCPAVTGVSSPAGVSALHPTMSSGDLGRFSTNTSSSSQQRLVNCQRQQEPSTARSSTQVRDNTANVPTASRHLRPEAASRLPRLDGADAASAAASQQSSSVPQARSHTQAEGGLRLSSAIPARPFYFQPVRTTESVCVATTASSSEWVVLNVGGRPITTTIGTLMADPDSVLASLCTYLAPSSEHSGTGTGKTGGVQNNGSHVHQDTSGRCVAISGVTRLGDETPIGGTRCDLPGYDHLFDASDLTDSRDTSVVRNGACGGGVETHLHSIRRESATDVSQAADGAVQRTRCHVDSSAQRDGDCFSPFSDPYATNRTVHHCTAPGCSTPTSPLLPQSSPQPPASLSTRHELPPTSTAVHIPSPVTVPLGRGFGEEGDGEAVNPQQMVSVIPLDTDRANAILLDLDADYFLPVLNYMRHGVAMIPPYLHVDGVLAMAEYLNVMGLVRLLRGPQVPRRVMLFSWGSGSNGELGTHAMRDESTPTMAQVTPYGVQVQEIVLGANYTCVLSDTGSVYTFGNGEWGQLGLGGSGYAVRGVSGGGGEGGVSGAGAEGVDMSVEMLIPRRIPLFERLPAVHVAAGYAFAMAIVEDHHVYFWGNNNHGQSGRGRDYFSLPTKKVEAPVLVETLEGKNIIQLSCGSFFALALSEDGSLYSWGLVDCVGLGTPEEVAVRYHDVLGESLSNERRTVVLTPQLVTVKGRRRLSPTGEASTASERIVCVRAGQWHSGAISDHGELFTWGVGYQGRLGQGSKAPAYVPTLVRGTLEGHRVVDVACGSFHTVALTTTGAVFCWGDNASGQCGTTAGSPDAFTAPYRVVGLEYVAGGVARSVACGRQNTVVVMEGPQPWCQRPCCCGPGSGGMGCSHAQAYSFGEVIRSANMSGSTTTATTTTTVVGATRGTGSSTHLGVSTGASSSSALPTASNHGFLRTGGDAMAFPLRLPVPCTAGRHHPHYKLVPDLQGFDVRGVVSGLHHTFAYVEELCVGAALGPGSVCEDSLGMTRGGAHRPSCTSNPLLFLPPQTAWAADMCSIQSSSGPGGSTSGATAANVDLARLPGLSSSETERPSSGQFNTLTARHYDSLTQDMFNHQEMVRGHRQALPTALRARFPSMLQMDRTSDYLPFPFRGLMGGRGNPTQSRTSRGGGSCR